MGGRSPGRAVPDAEVLGADRTVHIVATFVPGAVFAVPAALACVEVCTVAGAFRLAIQAGTSAADFYAGGSLGSATAGSLVSGSVPALKALIGRRAATSAAANGARVFASTDAHVASAANSIEAALPGRVVGVNTQRVMSNGLTREVDIDLGDLLVQVKSGNARGLDWPDSTNTGQHWYANHWLCP